MLSIVVVASLSSCAHAFGSKKPKDIKIYDYQPDNRWCKEDWCVGKAGFVRAQAEEVIDKDSEESRDMVGLTSNDFARILEACPR